MSAIKDIVTKPKLLKNNEELIKLLQGKLTQTLTDLTAYAEGVLKAGEDTIIIESEAIKEGSLLDVFASYYGMALAKMESAIGSVTLTFQEAQKEDVTIVVVITNP